MSKTAELVENENDKYHYPWKCSECDAATRTMIYVWEMCIHDAINFCGVCGAKFTNPYPGKAQYEKSNPSPWTD